MRKNTGCGRGHDKCPPHPKNDVAKNSRSLQTEVYVQPFGDEEKTVVLQDVFIQSLTEADFHLPTHATDIKTIRKNVRLTQCKAIPVIDNNLAVKLFVEGIVHKNIQYVEDGTGNVKDYSIDVPFRAYHKVTLAKPITERFYSSKNSNTFEYRELADDGMGADRCEFGSLTFEINNEPIQCKLLASAVNQLDIVSDFDNWGRFRKVTEKMDIILLVKLTQLQQRSSGGADEENGEGSQSTAAQEFRRRLGI
ncbi:hypothetical protein LCL89_10155 [Halobacillus yeomjeoni]|uniref:CsxC family protein n=1 Tax=Halobacillus yeomjeoni TaxID=311194 RepID=UPI001CD1E1AC|nr:hypothetical protein [Halobacillus yeomjeoni]MCA0984408.1 hypothetical protein [Halobacillus yeomjeoni]